jgi:glutamate-1-semialdehyde 2,1-aminomutase
MALTNDQLFKKSKEKVPGGVHSPVRSFKGLPMAPRFIKEANGAHFTDIEGKDYIDFCMSFGPLILGHADPAVREELTRALSRGWSYGACEPYSLELAEYLLERLPFAEMIRFVNSGTEAVMTAVRLARGFTGRNKIIKFDGCYHGHLDSMLIKAGSGLAGTAEASSAGVPSGVSEDTLIVPLDNEDALRACFNDHRDQIAAVIIEPLPANNGLLPQRNDYLKFLRTITKENGALLIFDEVISGLRVAFGGMAEKTGITPDLATYGKVIGGGLPVGAIAGPKEIMQWLAPAGPVYQAGTLSANPLAMVGGLATLKRLTKEAYAQLEENAKRIETVFTKWLTAHYPHAHFVREGSLFWIVRGENLRRIDQIPATLGEDFAPLFSELLERGVYLAPNAWEVGFVSLAHDATVASELEQRLWANKK